MSRVAPSVRSLEVMHVGPLKAHSTQRASRPVTRNAGPAADGSHACCAHRYLPSFGPRNPARPMSIGAYHVPMPRVSRCWSSCDRATFRFAFSLDASKGPIHRTRTATASENRNEMVRGDDRVAERQIDSLRPNGRHGMGCIAEQQ